MRLIVVALLNSLEGARSIAAAAENDIFLISQVTAATFFECGGQI